MSALNPSPRVGRGHPRLRDGAVLFPALAILVGACSGAAPSVPSATPRPADATPSAVSSVASEPTPKASVAIHLTGGLFYARFLEASHSFTGMFVSRVDGSGEAEIPMPSTEGGGRWSRAGTSIAVATVLPDGRAGTAVIGQDGSVARVLDTPDPTLNVVCNVWSRDDKRLACLGWDDAHPSRAGVYTVHASDGGDLQRVTTPPAGMIDEVGDYSSSGQLVFRRHPGNEGDGPLFTVATTGGTPHQLSGALLEDNGRFSPDGSSVLSSGQGALEIFDLKGNVVERIAVPGSYLFGPVWSPDGKRIAYSLSTTGPYADIYTSLPDGTDQKRITSTEQNEISVDWAPESH